MTRSDRAILQLLCTSGVGPRAVARVLAAAVNQGLSASDFVADPGLLAQLGLKPALVTAVAATSERAEELAERLEANEVRMLVKGQPDYPVALAQLGNKDTPPVLFAAGRLDLLNQRCVAFGGARNTSPQGLAITRTCAAALAQGGVNVVSGYANGVDLAAHAAALSAGGVTTLVLAEGILAFKPKPEIRDLLDEQRHLIISQFSPVSPWSAGNAMQRNAIILGLSDALVVVESGLDGGTFAAAELALAAHKPLFVVEYANPPESARGNRILLERGAIPLSLHADGAPDLTPLLATASVAVCPAVPHQRSLFEVVDTVG